MTCTLSVITPVFNGASYIESCIRNVIDQHCPEAEHIIVDGGSTDGTVEIIRRYANEHPHIRWISAQDRGQSDAMNKGIGMATGTILGFLNSDDFYEPGTLNDVIASFEDLPEPTLLVGNCNVWNDDGKLLFVNKPSHVSLLALLMLYVKAFPANSSAYFYHRSLHDMIGPYDVDEHYGMDIHFLFRAVQTAHVQYLDRTWGNYRYLTGTKTYEDVSSGRNKIRVAAIADYYRKQAPVHYQLCSSLFISLVKVYKNCMRIHRQHSR